jgi:tetratricopeptide (TPR) repeat protein
MILGILIAAAGVFVIFWLPRADDRSSEYVRDGNALYVNTSRDVKYVGTDECRDCHLEIYKSFKKTTTARSMYKLDTSNVIEVYPQREAVFDSVSKYYYEMLRRGNKFYQREYRLNSRGEVVHERLMEAQYVIGSGKDLRMYFYDENGMFCQLPLTWYVHKNRWNMSPGYREFGNVRFSRFATSKCLACHNAHMDASPDSRDRFQKPYPFGVGCESCHGPGELHVRLKKGESVSLPSRDAKTIVNPIDLSPQRQIDLCQQCHLQGKSWALYGDAGWSDFRPGMLLEDFWSVYAYATVHKEEFKVADSGFRFSLSRCYRESHGVTTCRTCHDSHGTFRGSATEFNRQNCYKCHSPQSLPAQGSKYVHKESDDCVSCHMNQTGTENTLHGVINTDHWIRIDARETKIDWTSNRIPRKLQPLQSLMPILDAKDSGAHLRMGIAYYEYYKTHDDRSAYLDSAVMYLRKNAEQLRESSTGQYVMGQIMALRGNYQEAIGFFERAVALKPTFADGYWRLGNLHHSTNRYDQAEVYYRKALQLKPSQPEYFASLGVTLLALGNPTKAAEAMERAIQIDQENPDAYYFLGTLYARDFRDVTRAVPYFEKLVVLNPDYENAYLSLGAAYVATKRYRDGITTLKKELELRPTSAPAYFNLGRAYALSGDKTQARLAFAKAKKLDPSMQVAQQQLEQL